MGTPVAIVGLACRYPDASGPDALWQTVMAQRRAFRRIPSQRLRAEDYYSPDRSAPDRTYAVQGAVIEGYEFDRLAFRIAGSTFRSADMAHWLALDVAAQALDDAGFARGEGLPREMTGVILGNTLTGEFSRANVMRLRWPYVARVVGAQLAEGGWSDDRRRALLAQLEVRYKSAFPPVGEETLAGGLSNTIAGRICNHFDFKGGGYTVDGACAASLLSVCTACTGLVSGDLDVALAGGVDLSLDPFELVGFAKTGALAPELMRVYDRRSAGFWPGEGCGVAVLMRLEDALASRRRIYAVIHGWGISSDGGGGITRPTVDGQLLALQRAYRRAGFGPDTVGYFEGHGTGTEVGDANELEVLITARRRADAAAAPAAIGSIKANFGHTKAAAGIAGLIKATLSLHRGVIPPTSGCDDPHRLLTGAAPALRVLRRAEPWAIPGSATQGSATPGSAAPGSAPRRAAVSAMGFGGINTHVVLEAAPGAAPRTGFSDEDERMLRAPQDAELFVFAAGSTERLKAAVDRVRGYAASISRAQMSDLAAALAADAGDGAARAAVVASAPADLAALLDTVSRDLSAGVQRRIDVRGGVFLRTTDGPAPRVGLLFSGQGVTVPPQGGLFARRFPELAGLFPLPPGDGVATVLAQPAIAAASVAGLRVLRRLSIEGNVGLGHSLGELVAFAWGGAYDEGALRRIVQARGAAMNQVGGPTGGMISLALGAAEAQRLIGGLPLVIAALNGPARTVVSGELAAVAALEERARRGGVLATRLAVSHAFHSYLMADALPELERALARESFGPLQRPVISTVTGGPLSASDDLPRLLLEQLRSPVRFMDAARAMQADLVIEVGPGDVFGRLFAECRDVPVASLAVGGESLTGLLSAVGAAFALGAPVRVGALFHDRFTRPFDLDWTPRFFTNPCESIDWIEIADAGAIPDAPASAPAAPQSADAIAAPTLSGDAAPAEGPPLEVLRALVAQRAELPVSAVHDQDRFLSDLHLNSITVGQLVGETARRLGWAAPVSLSSYADATLAEAALALEDRQRLEPAARSGGAAIPAGIEPWIRAYFVEEEERPCPAAGAATGAGEWSVLGTPGGLDVSVLTRALERAAPEGGVFVALPPDVDERHIDLLLEAGKAALHRGPDSMFLMLTHGGGAASFARSLHMEGRGLRTRVVDAPLGDPRVVEWVAAEAAAAGEHLEARYDAAGRRFESTAHVLPPGGASGTLPLGRSDVLLVTGGGKGIAAECARSLARRSGAALIVVGRSDPGRDVELSANLTRLREDGVRFAYVTADVTDAESLSRGIAGAHAQARLGPVTAVLHAAGTNVPQLITALDKVAMWRTLAPKTAGLRHVLSAIDPSSLRLLITFGSIIARIGLDGEADYALANEWQTRLTLEWKRDHPHCRCLAVEWSVWSGVGMGQRLGRLETLLAKGVTPIAPESGVEMLESLLCRDLPSGAIIVSGRFGRPPTLRLAGDELPLWRFLERPRVHYPGVELVVDADLTATTDPYVDDHVFGGEPLVPAVMGMEAMAQAAMALAGEDRPPHFDQLELTRPLVVPRQGGLRIRLAALRRVDGGVEVALRCDNTDFAVDHFRAVCRFEGIGGAVLPDPPADQDPACATLDPVRDLYEGGLLFHRGRFRVLRRYRRLAARRCVAEVAGQAHAGWFAHYLPRDLMLGDPALRDGAIHAIQACIPQARLLPIGAESVQIGRLRAGAAVVVHAVERLREGSIFVYDMEIRGEGGELLEGWRGLRLKAVEPLAAPATWPEALLAAYVERRAEDAVPGAMRGLALALNGPLPRPARSDEAIAQALGAPVRVTRRADGRPLLAGEDAPWVSVAHSGALTLAIVGPGPLGCDLQAVEPRTEQVWAGLLPGPRLALARRIAAEVGEPLDCAATRVWAAAECLMKAQVAQDAPLILEHASRDGWVVLGSGRLRVLTYGAPVRGREHPLMVAVAGHAAAATLRDS